MMPPQDHSREGTLLFGKNNKLLQIVIPAQAGISLRYPDLIKFKNEKRLRLYSYQ